MLIFTVSGFTKLGKVIVEQSSSSYAFNLVLNFTSLSHTDIYMYI